MWTIFVGSHLNQHVMPGEKLEWRELNHKSGETNLKVMDWK